MRVEVIKSENFGESMVSKNKLGHVYLYSKGSTLPDIFHFPMPLKLYPTISRMQMLVDGENLDPDTEDGEDEDVRFSFRRHKEVHRSSSPSVSESKFS